MSYLLDKKIKEKKILKITLGIVVLIFLFYFRANIFDGLSSISQGVSHPVLVLGNIVGEKIKSVGSYFVSKNSLYQQNQKLQADLNFDEARMSNYDSVVADNASLKEILGGKDPKTPLVLAAILAKPNQSPYDTLVIDAGLAQGIKTGNTVFALGYDPTGKAIGDVPIGRIAEVYQNSSKVILFSSPGETTEAVIENNPAPSSSQGGNVFTELTGRGGGNFEMILPIDLTVQKGNQVDLPGTNPYLLAIIETVISDPRDPSIKALLQSPVNVQELKFVEVEI